MKTLNVLLLGAPGDKVIEEISAVDPCIRVVDARGKFEIEYAQTWPAESVRRYVPQSLITQNTSTRAERNALLAEAEVICVRFPFPLDLLARAPRLKWLHQTPAGASNLRIGDIWGSQVMVTTSRGLNNALPIAEYVLATMLLFAKSLPQAFKDQARRAFDRQKKEK
jgi:phosphoglycerate dehydrogenase-like enzyme